MIPEDTYTIQGTLAKSFGHGLVEIAYIFRVKAHNPRPEVDPVFLDTGLGDNT